MSSKPHLDPTLPIHFGSRNARFGNENPVSSHDITLEQSGAIDGREERQISVWRREVMPKALVLEEDVKGTPDDGLRSGTRTRVYGPRLQRRGPALTQARAT